MDESDICARLDALIEVNRAIQQWLKVMALEQVGDTVRMAIGDDAANHDLYSSLDGETPVSDVVEDIGMSRRTAYRRLNDWQRIGIVSRVGRGTYDKLVPLESLGIESSEDSE